MTVQIFPSILSADFANLASELERIDKADGVHVDVMDNHFVPNLTLGLPIVERLQQVSPLPLDVHLMVENADQWAPVYADAGVASVTFHREASLAPVRLARELHSRGTRVCMGLRPGTAVDSVIDLLGEIDMLLIMSVEPGFGGQSFIERSLAKVRRAREIEIAEGLDFDIQLDGGIGRDTIAWAATAGANIFVAGSAVYGAQDPNEEIDHLRRLAVDSQG